MDKTQTIKLLDTLKKIFPDLPKHILSLDIHMEYDKPAVINVTYYPTGFAEPKKVEYKLDESRN